MGLEKRIEEFNSELNKHKRRGRITKGGLLRCSGALVMCHWEFPNIT